MYKYIQLYKNIYFFTYLPKYIISDELYPEKYNDDKLTIYIDHFKYQNEDEREVSIKSINKIFGMHLQMQMFLKLVGL